MLYPNPNPILGHYFIAPDTISYHNLYKILSGGTLLWYKCTPDTSRMINAIFLISSARL